MSPARIVSDPDELDDHDLPDAGALAAGELGAAAVALDTHFQPVASVRRGAVLGVEALARGRQGDGGTVPPRTLFAAAQRAGSTAALDRACRRLALARFAPLHRRSRSLVCFVNCQVETFLTDVDGPEGWPALAAAAGIDPRALAIEVLETATVELASLAEATARYRAAGFLVVLDDAGVGHGNLDRLAALRPDLLKADRALVHGCAHDRVRRAVLRALVGLSEEIGGWLVVKGVEREEDALAALELGVDLVQGFHLGYPAPLADPAALGEVDRRAVALAARFRARVQTRAEAARERVAARAAFARTVAATLAPCDAGGWPRQLADLLPRAPGDPAVATGAVLDVRGVQLTPTVRLASGRAADRFERTLIFPTPGPGDDHGLKEYVYLLGAEPDAVYESATYVPLPNERVCVTVTTRFADRDGAPRVLCLHLSGDPPGAEDGAPPPEMAIA